MDWSSGKIAVISSLDVVISGSGREDPSTLIAAADEAFYRAKPRVESGLNSTYEFEAKPVALLASIFLFADPRAGT